MDAGGEGVQIEKVSAIPERVGKRRSLSDDGVRQNCVQLAKAMAQNYFFAFGKNTPFSELCRFVKSEVRLFLDESAQDFFIKEMALEHERLCRTENNC